MSPARNEQQEHIVPIKTPGVSSEKLSIIESVPREIRSRRKRWLELNPVYFESASADLELTDPLAYDRLIRQHQTTAEREAEGKKRGWASTLETSLLRGEAKLAKADPMNPKYQGGLHTARRNSNHGQAQRKGPSIDWTIEDTTLQEADEQTSTELDADEGDENLTGNIDKDAIGSSSKTDPKSRRLGGEQWHTLLAQRFVDGYDENFDYTSVDQDASLNEETGGEKAQEDWFEDEEEHLESLEGETGVQDY